MKKLALLFAVLLLSGISWAQGVIYYDSVLQPSTGGFLIGVANAQVRVCLEPASGVPCSPTSVYSDPSLLPQYLLQQPIMTDSSGQYQVFVPPGLYRIQITPPFGAMVERKALSLGGGNLVAITALDIQQNGVSQGTITSTGALNFTNCTVTPSGSTFVITCPSGGGGGGGLTSLVIQQTGSTIGTITTSGTLNFQTGCSVTLAGSVYSIICSGGGGGSPPGAPNNSLQFNLGGVFTGSNNLQWLNSTNAFSVVGSGTFFAPVSATVAPLQFGINAGANYWQQNPVNGGFEHLGSSQSTLFGLYSVGTGAITNFGVQDTSAGGSWWLGSASNSFVVGTTANNVYTAGIEDMSQAGSFYPPQVDCSVLNDGAFCFRTTDHYPTWNYNGIIRTFSSQGGAETIGSKTFNSSNNFSGFFDVAGITTPAAPAVGNGRYFFNTTTGRMDCINSSGTSCNPASGITGTAGQVVYLDTTGTPATISNVGSLGVHLLLTEVGGTATPLAGKQALFAKPGVGLCSTDSAGTVFCGGIVPGTVNQILYVGTGNIPATVANVGSLGQNLIFTEITAPLAPAAGKQTMFVKAGQGVCTIDSASVQYCPGVGTVSSGGLGELAYYGAAGTTVSSMGGDFKWNGTHSLIAAVTGILDLSAAAATTGLKIPVGPGAAPTADGQIAVNSTNHTRVYGSNGTTLVGAAAATGTNSSTVCPAGSYFTTISGTAAPTCTAIAFPVQFTFFCTGTPTGPGTFQLVPGPSATVCNTNSGTPLQRSQPSVGGNALTCRSMYVNFSIAGNNAGSGVVTVLQNGNNSTALTCTGGTNLSCSLTGQSVAFAVNDSIGVQFTALTSDTVSTPKVTISCTSP